MKSYTRNNVLMAAAGHGAADRTSGLGGQHLEGEQNRT